MVRQRRGRGRGRGRGGRHGGRGARNNVGLPSVAADQEGVNEALVLDSKDSFDENVAAIFISPSTFNQHFKAQNFFRDRYLAILLTCKSRSIALSEGSKPKALAAAWARKDYELGEAMLKLPDEEFALKEVLKAVTILDTGRANRAKEKTLRRLEAQGCKKKGKMDQIKAAVGSLSKEIPSAGSLSGSVIQHIKGWLKTIPSERFEFFALHFPTDPWKKLADLLHLHPVKDVPQCPWFLPFVFGEKIPETILADALTEENVSEQVLGCEIDYTVARKFKDNLNDKAKLKIAQYTPINTLLW